MRELKHRGGFPLSSALQSSDVAHWSEVSKNKNVFTVPISATHQMTVN